jgi:hypothetical protein
MEAAHRATGRGRRPSRPTQRAQVSRCGTWRRGVRHVAKLWVELPGIEPGSSDAEPSILRAQSADRFSRPRHLSGHHVPTGSVAVEVPQVPRDRGLAASLLSEAGYWIGGSSRPTLRLLLRQQERSRCAVNWQLLVSRGRLRDNPGSSARFSWLERPKSKPFSPSIELCGCSCCGAAFTGYLVQRPDRCRDSTADAAEEPEGSRPEVSLWSPASGCHLSPHVAGGVTGRSERRFRAGFRPERQLPTLPVVAFRA